MVAETMAQRKVWHSNVLLRPQKDQEVRIVSPSKGPFKTLRYSHNRGPQGRCHLSRRPGGGGTISKRLCMWLHLMKWNWWNTLTRAMRFLRCLFQQNIPSSYWQGQGKYTMKEGPQNSTCRKQGSRTIWMQTCYLAWKRKDDPSWEPQRIFSQALKLNGVCSRRI